MTDPSWAELEAASANAQKAPRARPTSASPPPKPEEMWKTGADAGQVAESRVEWVWAEYLARGTVSELDGKIKVSGKTCFCHHLTRAILDGEPFLDRATLRGAVVYLTEEGPATFERALLSRGLKGRPDFHYLSRRSVAKLPWGHVVDLARAKVVETGAVLVVVDTLSRCAGFQADDENSAGRVMAAMTPLLALATSLNVAVLVTRHERRAGGPVGESARGSTAISGDVDQILQLTRTGGDSHQNERWLRAVGRYDETPPELRIVLERGRYRVIGSQDAQLRAAEAILDLLQPSEPMSAVELAAELQADGHSRRSVYAAVQDLIAGGKVDQVDEVGRSGHTRKAIVLRSSAAPERAAAQNGLFDLRVLPDTPPESIVSRTSPARAHLLADLNQESGSDRAGEHPRSERDRFALAALSSERPAVKRPPTVPDDPREGPSQSPPVNVGPENRT